MSTLTLIPITAHPILDSFPVRPSAEPVGLTSQIPPAAVLAVLVALLLVWAAIRQLGRTMAPIGELVRMVVSATVVLLLLLGTVAVLLYLLTVTVHIR